MYSGIVLDGPRRSAAMAHPSQRVFIEVVSGESVSLRHVANSSEDSKPISTDRVQHTHFLIGERGYWALTGGQTYCLLEEIDVRITKLLALFMQESYDNCSDGKVIEVC